MRKLACIVVLVFTGGCQHLFVDAIVVDGMTEAPVPGAKATLVFDKNKGKPNAIAETDRDGQTRMFTNWSLTPQATLTIEKEGYRPWVMQLDRSRNKFNIGLLPHQSRPTGRDSAQSDPNTVRVRLDDIKLGPETTRQQILSAWGYPNHVDWHKYDRWVYKQNDGRPLILVFSWNEPHGLLKAETADRDWNSRIILYDGLTRAAKAAEKASCPRTRFVGPAYENIVCPTLADRRLKLTDFEFDQRLTLARVLIDWGPPDQQWGSGITYMGYELEDGRMLSLVFLNRPALLSWACILGNAGEGRTIIFEAGE